MTRLKGKDVPEPWTSSKKKSGGRHNANSNASKISDVEDQVVLNAQVQPRKRGRPSAKSASKVTAVPKGMKKTGPLGASAVNILLGVSATAVADVEEQRQKRRKDAEDSGRIVRTISPHQRSQSSPTIVRGTSTSEDAVTVPAAVGPSSARTSPRKHSRTKPTAADNNKENEERLKPTMGLDKAPQEERESLPSRRPGKEPIEYTVEEMSPQYQEERNSTRPSRVHVASSSDNDSRQKIRGQRGDPSSLVCSPTRKTSGELYVGRTGRLIHEGDEGFRGHQHSIRKSHSRSPRQRNYSRRHVSQGWSPEQSKSHSRAAQEYGRIDHSALFLVEDDDYSYRRRGCEDYYTGRGFRGRDHRRQGEYPSSSPENRRQQWRSRSREDGRSAQRRMRTPYSSMSPTPKSVPAMSKERSDVGAFDAHRIVDLSPTSDKRRRRREQAVLNADMLKRERGGHKPFYLMLDREGKPYGAGKPSWIAEINKLSSALDPSCTNIRKQTFEDVQTFKDRLDDNFQYSGTLNQDYLRSLMGRAVTKRRSEWIHSIRIGAKQPKHIDYHVWKSLEKLATSKQREERSEQGRHANACRQVVGRTGRTGIHGVREKLRSLLGRSPDPSEIDEEMRRDKGCGGRKKNQPVHMVKKERKSAEVESPYEDPLIGRGMRNSSPDYSDSESDEAMTCHETTGVMKNKRRHARNEATERDKVVAEVDNALNRVSEEEVNVMEKDDYISELEAKIKMLQEEKAKLSTLNMGTTSKKSMN